MDLENEVTALREAAEQAAARVLATDPRNLEALVIGLEKMAEAHAKLGGMPVEDVLDTYVCALSSAAGRRWSECSIDT